MRYVESINRALHRLLASDARVLLLGEDLLDPYGGAFKVTKGLSTEFPERVLSTPISESAIIGAATGLALRGRRPVAEIMFGDFLYLAADQIVNHATKFGWMYNGQVEVPLVIRAPVGGGRGYGPTHSQSPESAFLGVPGLTIVAPSLCHDPGELLRAAVQDRSGVTLFLEHKLLYPKDLFSAPDGRQEHFHLRRITPPGPQPETVALSMQPGAKPDLTVICYGGMLPPVMAAANYLFMEFEWNIEIVVPAQFRPVPATDLLGVAARSGRVLVVEEGCLTGGWGGEVAALIHEAHFRLLDQPVQRLAALDCPIPSGSALEREVLPTVEKIRDKIRAMLG